MIFIRFLFIFLKDVRIIKKKFLIYLSVSSFIIIVSIFIIINLNKNTTNSNLGEQNKIEESNRTIEKSYFYIDSNNDLIRKAILDGKTYVIDNNILEFDISKDSLIYVKKENNSSNLEKLNLNTNEKKVLIENYNNDFICDINYVYVCKDYSISKINLENESLEKIVTIPTEDMIFNDLDDDILSISYMDNHKSSTFVISLKDNKKQLVDVDMYNVLINDGFIYGFNDNFEMVKYSIDSLVGKVLVPDIVKFTISEENLIYLDSNGNLNSFSNDGKNKLISSNVNTFEFINDNIFYISVNNSNTVYRTNKSGEGKRKVIENIKTDSRIKYYNNKR